MGLKELFGLGENDSITETEIMEIIKEAKKNNKEVVEIKGVRVNIKNNEYFECGIED